MGIREVITKQREKRLPISYLALKLGYINKTKQIYTKWSSKVFISIKLTTFYLALKLGYINKTHYTQSGAENSLLQFCLTIGIKTVFAITEMSHDKLFHIGNAYTSF